MRENFLILKRIRQYIIINVHKSSCKVPVILCQILIKLNFLGSFSKNPET